MVNPSKALVLLLLPFFLLESVQAAPARNVLLITGTFDPITENLATTIENLIRTHQADAAVLVVTDSVRVPAHAPLSTRVTLVQKQFENNPRVSVDSTATGPIQMIEENLRVRYPITIIRAIQLSHNSEVAARVYFEGHPGAYFTPSLSMSQ